jgi:hypothetical protein
MIDRHFLRGSRRSRRGAFIIDKINYFTTPSSIASALDRLSDITDSAQR